jgi:RHS repeat-associated protein
VKRDLRLLTVVLFLSACSLNAQTATGIPPLSSATGGPDVINLGNLNVHLSIPIIHKPGRGMPFTYDLSYDNSVWYPVLVSGSQSWQPTPNWGWRGITEVETGYVSYASRSDVCQDVRGHSMSYSLYDTWIYHDSFGVPHPFPDTLVITDSVGLRCNPPPAPSSATALAVDGSGYTISARYNSATVYPRSGGSINPPLQNQTGGGSVTDSNGNQLTASGTGSFSDTLGMSVLNVAGTAPSNTTYQYTDSNGQPQYVTVSYIQATVQTNFSCSVSQFGPTSTYLIYRVTYPDNSFYQFDYEPTSSGSNNVTGRLKTLTLPSGGVIRYDYSGAIECADGSAASLSRTTPDGQWTYSRTNPSGSLWTTTVQSPLLNKTIINFQQHGNNFFEKLRQNYQGQSALLRTTYTCYNGTVPDCSSAAIFLPINQASTTTQLDNNFQSKVTTLYNSFGLPTETDEYDWANGAPGALLRKTITSYAALGNGIVDRVSSVEVQDGGGARKAYATYGYDEYGTSPLVPTSGVPRHIAISGSRGNLTSVNQWLNATGGTLPTNLTYEDTGNVLTSTDPGGHQTQFSYADSFAGGQTPNAHAYVTTATMPITHSPNLANHVITAKYDINTALITYTSDQNGNYTTYSYDSMLRPVQVNYPDGGKTVYTYYGISSVWKWHYLDSTHYTDFRTDIDGLGRTDRTAYLNAEGNWDQQDTCFDADGRPQFTSYPYQGSGFGQAKVCSGSGDAYLYDALNRPTKVTHSDGSAANYGYNGRATQIQDEGNGSYNVTKILQGDGLGRLAFACEVSGGSLLGSGSSPAPCGLDYAGTGFLTSYGYDLLNNLTHVDQGGYATRTYGFDSLSRMTSETFPEQFGCTTSYNYNNDSLLLTRIKPAPNQNSCSTTLTTTYAYDEMHRIRSRTYSDGVTPPNYFSYDESNPWGAISVNPIGNLTTAVTDNVPVTATLAGDIFPDHDAMGRVRQNGKCTPRTCGSSGYTHFYTYDELGNTLTFNNAGLYTLTNGYNSAGRLTSVTSSLVDAQHPSTLVNNVHYGAFGVVSDQLGNGLLETAAYNPRGFQINNTVGQGHTSFGTNNAPFGWLDFAYNSYNQNSATLPQFGSLYTYGWAADNEDGSPVARVAIDVDGSPIGDATLGLSRPDVGTAYNRSDYNSSGYQFTGTIGALSTGTHTVHATAYDWTGNAGSLSGSKQITVASNSAPFGNFESATNPSNGSASIPQGGSLLVSGWAVDSDSNPGSPVNKVEIRIDGILWGTATLGSARPDVATAYNRSDYTNSGWQATFNIGNTLSAGTHFLTATAYDSLGGSGSVHNYQNAETITVTGSNPGTPAAPAGPVRYSYDLNFVGNGAVLGSTDLINGTWNYGYDAFNRLASAGDQGVGFSYDYDRFGNRWHQNLTSGQGPQPMYAFDTNNHISGSGISYDVLGNVLNDGLGNSFTYDGENRLLTANGNSYVYDAFGRRVKGALGEVLYDLSGKAVVYLNASTGSWTYGELYAGGRHIATYSGGTTNFLHTDWLGTKRATTSVSGALTETCTSLPFGDAANCSGTNWSFQSFTDDVHDAVSNTEHTLFRQLSTTEGRWFSPDPYLGSMNLTNPQSLNRYAYVNNNPMNAVDPLGLQYCVQGRSGAVYCEGGGDSGDSGCTLDGIATPCSIVEGLQSQGAAGPLAGGITPTGFFGDVPFLATLTLEGTSFRYFGCIAASLGLNYCNNEGFAEVLGVPTLIYASSFSWDSMLRLPSSVPNPGEHVISNAPPISSGKLEAAVNFACTIDVINAANAQGFPTPGLSPGSTDSINPATMIAVTKQATTFSRSGQPKTKDAGNFLINGTNEAGTAGAGVAVIFSMWVQNREAFAACKQHYGVK